MPSLRSERSNASGMLDAVNRLTRILLLAFLAWPQLGQPLLPLREVCAEERGCCEQNGACDVTCVACACCAVRVMTFTDPGVAEDLEGPTTPSIAANTAAPPLAPPSDILHVPKSA